MEARLDPPKLEALFRPVRDDAGLLIAMVGFDASGKTTQIERLAARFRTVGREVVETRQPSDWYRRERAVQDFHAEGGTQFRARILALFAAADRLRHVQELIDPALQRGAVVICDRYVYATFGVFLHRGVDADFLTTINTGIPRPDHAFFLDVPTRVLAERLRARDGDALQFEERSTDRIESIVRRYHEMGPLLTRIDGNRPIDEVADDLWARVTH